MAGQNADMTLKVGLDLNFFRQELQKASSSLAGQPIDINVRFNKKGIADQYRLLTRYLGGKKSFDVKIESNTLEALTGKVANFQKTLKALKNEKIELSINASANIEKFSKEKIRKIRAQIRSDIVSGGAGEIQLPTKLAAPSTSAFIKDVAKKVKEQTSASYADGGIPIATKLQVPGITELLKALQKNLNRNPVSIATSFKESGKSEAALAKIIRNAEKNKAVLGTELAPLGADEIAEFRRTVESKLSGIKVTVDATLGKGFAAGQTGLAGLEEYMRTQGLSGGPRGAVETGRRAQFESLIGSASSAELKRYMKTAEIAGRSALTTKAQMQEALLKINDVAMENILGNMKMQMRDPLPVKRSFLDQVARAVFWMAGVDPAYLKQQAAQRRALPSVDFPGTVPPRNIPIGPSGTGRALPPGTTPSALPGTSFGGQKYLPTALSDELKTILRGAAFAFVDSLKQQVRGVRMGLGATQQPLLGPSRIAGLLPAGVGRAPSVYSTGAVGGETRAEMMARREREARMRSDLRGIDVIGGGAGRIPSPYSYAYRGARPTSAIVPYAAGGAIVPQPAMASGAGGGMQPPGGGGGFGGFGGAGGFGGFSRAMGGINLPGAGTIRELGDEFGFATKQLLLFGQAYKLLGFIQSFPGQVATAVSALQSFRNTLGAISPTAKEAQLSNELILALVEKYNIPLESARQGFTKLYASMQPAGFSGVEISKLFTGISKASATLGLSSDKVDRVTYAFSQMASKGQLMSEEVSGQLGDVIPGALSIMAEAAGMGIGEFKKAMEDGEFVGARFTEVMNKVPEVLEKRFGKGAEGAAKTFQGAMNNMQTSVTLFYESFEPAAVAFLNMFVTPISRQLKDLADGFTAFFSKTNAQTIGGQGIADELNKLRPAFEGIITNMQAFVPTLKTIGDVALGVAKAFTAIAGNPIAGMLAKVYVQILLLTTAFKILTANAIAQTVRSLIGMVTQIGLTNNAMVLLQKNAMSAQMQMTLLTAKTGKMAGAFQSGSLAVTGLGAAIKSALLGGVITAAILIVDQLINRIQRLRAEAEAVGARGKGARAEVKAAYAGGIESGRNTAAGKEAEARSATKLSGIYRKLASATAGEGVLTTEEIQFAREMGADLPQFTGKANRQGLYGVTRHTVPGPMARGEYERLSLQQAQTAQSIRDGIAKGSREGEEYAAAQAARTAKEERKLQDDLTKNKKNNAEKLANQAQQLDIDAAKRQNALDKTRFDHLLKMSEAEFEQWKSLQDAKYDYEIAGLNSIEARQLKFQKDLQQIEINRIETIRKAAQAVAEAEQEVVATERTAAAAKGGMASTGGGAATTGGKLPSGITQYITGDPSSPYYRADHGGGNYHEHLAFASRALAEAAYQQLTKAGVQVTEFKGRSSVGRHTPGSAHYSGLAFDVPGAQVPVGQERQLTARVQSILGFGGGGYTQQRRTEKAGGEEEVAKLQASLRATEMLAIAQDSYTLALEKTKALIKQNITTIFPVAELQLETSLLKMRNQLQMQGMPQEYIQYTEAMFKAEYEANAAKQAHSKTISEYEVKIKDLQEKQAKGIELTADETKYLKYASDQIKENTGAISTLAEQQKIYEIAQLESAIATMKNADAMKAMQETAERIDQAVGGITGTYKEMFKEIAKGGDYSEIERVQQELDKAREEGDKKAVKRLEEQLKNMSPFTPVLKKVQEELADQALTMFFDFAMQPVEKFFKDQLGAIFGLPNEEEQRKATLAKMQEQLVELQAIKVATQATANNAGGGIGGGIGGGTQQNALAPGGAIMAPGGAINYAEEATSKLPETVSSLTESADAYSEQLDKVDASVWGSTMSLGQAGEQMGPNGAAGKTWQQSLGSVVGGIGMAAGSIMGIMAGINQIKEGGTSNVLGGIGMIASMAGSLLGGFSGLFGGGSTGMFGTSSSFNGTADALAKAPFAPKLGAVFADGGIAAGGFRAFANGGMVNGPTLGLIGEGRYNEAVVPLPNGRAIPVQINGGRSARDLMGSNAPGMANAAPLTLKFESTKINGVEYVSREQLELAMAETRRASIAGGATRGMNMALDKIQQSPSTRSRIGIR
jgi:tape measure domain-containing protein